MKATAPTPKAFILSRPFCLQSFPLVDYAKQEDGEYVAYNSHETLAQLQARSADVVRLVTLAYALRVCRAWDKTLPAREAIAAAADANYARKAARATA